MRYVGGMDEVVQGVGVQDVVVQGVRMKNEAKLLSGSPPGFLAYPRMFLNRLCRFCCCMLSHVYIAEGREMVHSGCVLWGDVSLSAGLLW